MLTYDELHWEEKQSRLNAADAVSLKFADARPLGFLFAGMGMLMTAYVISSKLLVENQLEWATTSHLPQLFKLEASGHTVGMAIFGSLGMTLVLHLLTLAIKAPVKLLGLHVFGTGGRSTLSAAIRISAISEFAFGALALAFVLLFKLNGVNVWTLMGMAVTVLAIVAMTWQLTAEFFDLDGLDPLWCWAVIVMVEWTVYSVLKFL